MDLDLVNSMVTVSKNLERFVQQHPDTAILVTAGAVVCCLIALLFSLRRARHAREHNLALKGKVRSLEIRLKELTKGGGDGGGVSAELDKTVEVGEGAIPLATSELASDEQLSTSVRDKEAGTEAYSAAAGASGAEHIEPKEAPIEIPVETAISRGLRKSRIGFISRLSSLFSGRTVIDSATLEDLEEALILSDVGARCAANLVEEVRNRAQSVGESLTPSEVTRLLKEGILNQLHPVPANHRMYHPTSSPLIVLVVGVNGVGKTTTVAKLAAQYMQQGKKVLAVAADTFRAAAVEQLGEWSNRLGFTLVRGAENAKPSAVVFDGMLAAKEGAFDVVLIDTAGRLHTKSNLMQELEGVRNSIRKHFPDGPHETVLVLDGVSGQNALSQAREFNQAVQLTGLIVTKLDGTPKGGIIIAISQELSLPVFYIGVGEKVEDLITFRREAFVDALFDEDVTLALDPNRLESRAGND